MKRSELREIIKASVKRKLREVNYQPGKDHSWDEPAEREAHFAKPQHGVVVDKSGDDPKVQVVGHGVAKLSSLKKTVVDALAKAHKDAQSGNFKNVEHTIKENGVLTLLIRAIVEATESLESGNELDELSTFQSSITTSGTTAPGDAVEDVQLKQDDEKNGMSSSDTRRLEKAKKDQEKLTNDVRKIDGTEQKLQTPIQSKIQRLDRDKAKKEKDLAKATKDAVDIQKKYNKI